jgi:arsenate reductase
MAEAFLNKFGYEKFISESAGLEPGVLNPLVVKVMGEAGIDISKNITNSVEDFYKQRRIYDYVITVCDETSGERCPIFPGGSKKLHWTFDDPSTLTGTEEDKIAKIRLIRDNIKEKILDFIKTV